MGKHSKQIRPSKNWWDYTQDGRFPEERIKGKDKALLKRKTRRREEKELKRMLEQDWEDLL